MGRNRKARRRSATRFLLQGVMAYIDIHDLRAQELYYAHGTIDYTIGDLKAIDRKGRKRSARR